MVLPTDLGGAIDPSLDWRRPHPITIVVEIGRAIRSVIIAVIILSGGLLDQSTFLELALVATPLIGGLARWYTTRYALDDDSVHHHHGLIWRKKQVLPRSNVQNVSTKAGLLARLTSVVQLQISDASATGDISIRYVTQAEADRLATLLRTTAAQYSPHDPGGPIADRSAPSVANSLVGPAGAGPVAAAPAPAPTGPAVTSPPLISPPVGELLRTELTSASTVVAVLLAGLAAVLGPAVIVLAPVTIPDEAGRTPWLLVLAVVAMPILLTILSVGSRVLVLGGHRLHADPDRLRIQAGLVTEARVTARRERI
ncbi:MAG: PH domain-containing protein, partial [Acidimicrobiia bacterium]|nr:PH domain-containing protein [Acidimicrobiia bacterium]